jgi:transcriptional regulator with XRE-family HTH domain
MTDEIWEPDARTERIRRTLASNVKRERDRKGLSQEDLGIASGRPRGTVSRVERAQQEPRLSTLDAFSAALGVPLEAFLAGLLGSENRQQDQ